MRIHTTDPTRLVRLAAVAATAALLVAGCSSDDSGSPAPEPSPTAPAPSETATPEASLPDGDHFGFVTSVGVASTGESHIVLDPAEWINDDSADNGYRIENPDEATVTLILAADATIEVLTSTGDPSTATQVDAAGLNDWYSGLSDFEVPPPFNLTVRDGQVTSMTFTYRP